MITTMVLIEIEDSIKRYLIDNPQYLPEDADITTVDDFDVLLADYFDAMSGVSAGVWTSGYLSSRGGAGSVAEAFAERQIVRRYGNIIPGGARGLEVFFMEYGDQFYPGEVGLNVTPPTVAPELLTTNLTDIAASATAAITGQTAADFLANLQIPGVTAAFYPADGLEATLELFMGDVRLSEMTTFYIGHAYDLITRQNVYFVHDTAGQRPVTYTAAGVIRGEPREIAEDETGTSYEPDNTITVSDYFIRDVARASSAVPAIHPSHTVNALPGEDENELDLFYIMIDGAVITNNPALQALVFLTTAPREIPIDEIAMVSIGSGVPLLDLSTNVNSAALGWLINNELMTIMSDGSAENVQQQVDFLFYGNPNILPGQYLRIQTTAEFNSTVGEALRAPTDVEVLPVLRRRGIEVAETYRDAIDNYVANFIFAE